MKRLNLNKSKSEKNFVSVSSKEALKDVTPIKLAREALAGDKK